MRRATWRRSSTYPVQSGISIHALHEESDKSSIRVCGNSLLFQSTLSMRRATVEFRDRRTRPRISIHALHEESDRNQQAHRPKFDISIHALHEESDTVAPFSTNCATISIHALHEESDKASDADRTPSVAISIHALHEESDRRSRPFARRNRYFNPRSP